MVVKESKNSKSIIAFSKDLPKPLKELLTIRNDFKILKDSVDGFNDSDQIFKVLRKKRSKFFLAFNENFLTLGRSFDFQPLEILKFQISEMQPSSYFTENKKTIPPELFAKYFCFFQNIQNKKIENLFIDLLAIESLKANLSGIKYAWVLTEENDVFNLKFNRILNGSIFQEIGPSLKFKLVKEYYATDEVFERAFKVEKAKKQKNVTQNEFKDKVGRLFVDKQDLKNVNLKRSRAYKK